MDHEIIWSQAVSADLREAHGRIAQHNPTAADRLANEILDRVELLRSVPLMEAVYPRGATGSGYRVVVVQKYRIFYQVDEDARRVEVVRVWHGARQEPDLSSE